MGWWGGGLTLSAEHADSKWITEDDIDHFESLRRNRAIAMDTFEYMKKGWKTT